MKMQTFYGLIALLFTGAALVYAYGVFFWAQTPYDMAFCLTGEVLSMGLAIYMGVQWEREVYENNKQ